jgi:hypothetical protein
MAESDADVRIPMLQQLIFGFFPSAVLSVAVRLRIPDLVADGPMSSDELADATNTHPPSLYRLLRALAYLGILEETDPGNFGLTDMGALLRSDDPHSMAATTQLFCGEGVWRSWGDLMAGVQTGRPSFERGIGLDPFAEFAQNAEASRNFNRAMSEGTLREAPGILGSYDFTQFGTLVDVGGGADAYIMKSVIHDWDDEKCVTILSNCRQAMKADGKVLIVEPVVPETVKPSFALLGVVMSDLNMLVNTGGKERTEEEFASLLRSADLEPGGVSRLPRPSTLSVIEASIQ